MLPVSAIIVGFRGPSDGGCVCKATSSLVSSTCAIGCCCGVVVLFLGSCPVHPCAPLTGGVFSSLALWAAGLFAGGLGMLLSVVRGVQSGRR